MRLIDVDAFIKDNKEALLNAVEETKDRVQTDEQAYAVQAYILAVKSLLKNLELAPTIDFSKKEADDVKMPYDGVDNLQAATKNIEALLDLIQQICADQRETHGDESVCGLCEYDGPQWLGECPGYERDDCFLLKHDIRAKYYIPNPR